MKNKSQTLFYFIITILLAVILITYPGQAFEASVKGLKMWWEIVFPSLLPFFITAELLIGFGVVTFIGVLFEPIMRPLFNVPGGGSFAWMMGMASGYPSGAKITTRLREENILTQIEAERLVSFTNASSPLFIFGAIAVGFFHNPQLGLLIAVAHYIGNALVGICMRFHGKSEEKKHPTKPSKTFSVTRAFKEMHHTRMKHNHPLGHMLGQAVTQSIQTLLMIGGFIILFSVLTSLLLVTGITPLIVHSIQSIFHIIGIPLAFALPFLSGLFEITIGAQMIAQLQTDPILHHVILVSFMLGFNGLSVQAQVASIIAKTDIRFYPYFFARILHGIFASILAILLYQPLYLAKKSESVLSTGDQSTHKHVAEKILHFFEIYGAIITFLCLSIYACYILLKKRKHS